MKNGWDAKTTRVDSGSGQTEILSSLPLPAPSTAGPNGHVLGFFSAPPAHEVPGFVHLMVSTQTHLTKHLEGALPNIRGRLSIIPQAAWLSATTLP